VRLWRLSEHPCGEQFLEDPCKGGSSFFERTAIRAVGLEMMEMCKCKTECAAGAVRHPALSSGVSEANAIGNFLLGGFFGDVKCRHGHETRLFNIGRGHFVACDGCRTFMLVGSNLMGNWRQETEDVWQANSDSVQGYELLD